MVAMFYMSSRPTVALLFYIVSAVLKLIGILYLIVLYYANYYFLWNYLF